MENLLDNSFPKNKNRRSFGYTRRVSEVHSPCQWLKDCYNGKCPAFMRIAGNYYCKQREIP